MFAELVRTLGADQKELKIGFGMEQKTSGDFGANALWFALGGLAYNLTQAQKLLFMEKGWRS